MMKKTQKLIALALLTYFVIMLVTSLLGGLVEDKILLDAWYSILTVMPFGKQLVPMLLDVFSNSFGVGFDMTQYVQGVKPLTALEFFHDVYLAVLTGVIFEAASNFLQLLIGVKGKGGFTYAMMRSLCDMIAVVVCTIVAGLTFNYFYGLLADVPALMQGVLSGLVSSITMIGAVIIVYLIFGQGILMAIIFVAVKVIIVNILKVLAAYVEILAIILFLNEGAYIKLFASFAGFGIVLIALFGVEYMISSIFE